MKYIKRVIAIEGDLIAIENHKVILNGEMLNYSEVVLETNKKHTLKEEIKNKTHSIQFNKLNSNISQKASQKYKQTTVPKNMLFVLGDHRDNSSDSRIMGFFKQSDVIGKVVF